MHTDPLPSDFEINKFRKMLDYFRELSRGGVTGVIEDWLLNMMELTIPFQANFWFTENFSGFERITINKRVIGENNRIKYIKHLKYPPRKLVKKYGRCNLPGESVLYGTFNFLTAIAEMKPERGDLITRSIWTCINDNQLKYCPIFYNQPTSGEVVNPRSIRYKNMFERKLHSQYRDPLTREFIIELNKFISEQFSKPITTGNHRDYIFSSFFASKIFNEMEDGTIDAIHYPSVKEDLSLDNIAIKPSVFNANFVLSEVEESYVYGIPTKQSSGYILNGTGKTKNFDHSSGKINWNSN
ncbi:MAG: hypothetical protein WD607_00510 [Candidatus Paceibacterota bacterium]